MEIFGLLYRPENYEEGKTYPTVCYVYGGPDVQCVKNSRKLPRSQRHKMYTKFGYAVCIFDNRGSDNRGMAFEGAIRHRMGKVEIDDQGKIQGGIPETINPFSANFGWVFHNISQLRGNSARATSRRLVTPKICGLIDDPNFWGKTRLFCQVLSLTPVRKKLKVEFSGGVESRG